MEAGTDFGSLLAEALEQRRADIEANCIPRLRQDWQGLHASFRALLQLLEKKGLIQPDPYKRDERISELRVPSEEPFLDAERDTQMSIRLSQYDNQLDFLVNYFQFDLESMEPRQVRNLVALVRYIRWHQLSGAAEHPITRTLAEYVGRLAHDRDPLSSGIVRDCQGRLAGYARSILSHLKQIADFQREWSKLEIRSKLLPHCRLEPSRALADRQTTLKQLRHVSGRTRPGAPFYSDLTWEVLQEEYAPDSELLRRELLQRIRVQRQRAAADGQAKHELRAILYDAIGALAGAAGTLEDLLDRTTANVELLKQSNLTPARRFRRWFARLTKRKPDPLVLRIDIVADHSSATHSEDLDFDQFADAARTRIGLYRSLQNRSSSAFRRLEGAGEQQLFSQLQLQVEELSAMQRRFDAIDTYVRSELAREQRTRLHSVKAELQSFKEHLLRINKKRHQYIARKQEREQLQRLGIEVERA